MKIAMTADWHARGIDLDQLELTLTRMVGKLEAHNVQVLLHAGDVFDKPNICDSKAGTNAIEQVVVNFFQHIASLGIQSIIIAGNHDMQGVGDKSALAGLDGRENIKVVRLPSVQVIKGIFIFQKDVSILCLPWSWDRASMPVDFVSHHPNPDIFLAHVRVDGARMNDVRAYEMTGGDWAISRKELETIGAKYNALGDFHGADGYIGALRQLNFGEEGNPQGFKVLDTDTWTAEWVEIESPTYRTVVVRPGETPPQPDPPNHLKVRFEGGVDEILAHKLEGEGVVVEQVMDREERVQRADLSAVNISDPHSLIDLWTPTIQPAIPAEMQAKMHNLFDEVVFGKKKEAVSCSR